jgi:hypothetical protein
MLGFVCALNMWQLSSGPPMAEHAPSDVMGLIHKIADWPYIAGFLILGFVLLVVSEKLDSWEASEEPEHQEPERQEPTIH